MKALMDTCVLIDALSSRGDEYKYAQELMRLANTKRIELFLSAKSFLDVHYILKSLFHDETIVRTHLANLLTCFRLSSVTSIMLSTALSSPMTDYEDAVQQEVAIIEGVDFIITRDKAFKNSSQLPCYTAAEAIREYSRV